jgi:hypothetical protein
LEQSDSYYNLNYSNEAANQLFSFRAIVSKRPSQLDEELQKGFKDWLN